MNKIVKKEDFARICRFCLSQNSAADIFRIKWEETSLVDIIFIFFGTQISEGDDLPKNICENCKNEIENFYHFKTKYEQSLERLLKIIEEDKNVDYNLNDAIKIEEEALIKEEIYDDSEITLTNLLNSQKISIPPKRNKETVLVTTLLKDTQDTFVPRRRRRTKSEDKNDCYCSICDKYFSTKAVLKTHSLSHKGEKNFLCSYCGKSFYTKGNLNIHLVVHTGEKKYRCTICGKSFGQKAQLQKHQSIHSNHKPQLCDICLKSFRSKTELSLHSRSHSGEKPYTCPYDCEKTFATSGGRVRHVRVHTGEKPYVCDVCCKEFSQLVNLMRHRQRHKSKN